MQMTEKMKSYIDKGYEEAERFFARTETAAPEAKEAPVPQKSTPAPAAASKQNTGSSKQNAEKQEK